MAMVSIKDIPKVDVLMALWKASRMQGMSFIAYLQTGDLTRKAAEEYIELARRTNPDGTESIYFDYLNGKVIKVDIGQDEFDPRLYDRDNGENAAQRAIDGIQKSQDSVTG